MGGSRGGLVQADGSAGGRLYRSCVSRLRSFGHALRGLWVARTGPNFKIQLAGAAAVAVLASAYGLRRTHLALVILAATAVLAAELMNTAIERVCDLVDDLHGVGRDDRIRDIKDLAAGAVLLVCAGAAAVGVLVFLP
jgi:diacylglycerol kinase (ATP)